MCIIGKQEVEAVRRVIYPNWEPVMNRRGAHHPGRDAFRMGRARVRYSKDMCPKTLSILSRTVYLLTSATRSEEDLKSFLRDVRKALRHA
jgi:hypothetical protein